MKPPSEERRRIHAALLEDMQARHRHLLDDLTGRLDEDAGLPLADAIQATHTQNHAAPGESIIPDPCSTCRTNWSVLSHWDGTVRVLRCIICGTYTRED